MYENIDKNIYNSGSVTRDYFALFCWVICNFLRDVDRDVDREPQRPLHKRLLRCTIIPVVNMIFPLFFKQVIWINVSLWSNIEPHVHWNYKTKVDLIKVNSFNVIISVLPRAAVSSFPADHCCGATSSSMNI